MHNHAENRILRSFGDDYIRRLIKNAHAAPNYNTLEMTRHFLELGDAGLEPAIDKASSRGQCNGFHSAWILRKKSKDAVSDC
jgi:hypothetical protein